ncbi:MAG: ribokinase [Candidatus Izemoplasmatales bacterium]
MKNIFVVGSLNMDLVFSVKKVPKQGETLLSNNFTMLSGGKGANQAVASSFLGSTTYMIGNVGQDPFGNTIIDNLKLAGVYTDNIHKTIEKQTGVACVILSNNDNRIILDQGANGFTYYEQVRKALKELAKKDDVFLTQLEIPVNTVVKSIVLAKNMGLKTILNPAPASILPEEVYTYIDLIIPNEIEAEIITGYERSNADFDRLVVDFFISKGVKEVVITKGKQGLVYGNKKIVKKVDAFDVTVVDTTGAGDAFVGAIASEISKGRDVLDSLTFASAASAIAVSRFGAQKSMPTISEVECFIKGHSLV